MATRKSTSIPRRSQRENRVRCYDINQLSDEAIECRSFRHAFESLGDFDIERDSLGVPIQFTRRAECIVCGTGLVAVYEVPSMRRVYSRYDYPTNYLMHNRLWIDDARKEFIERNIPGGMQGKQSKSA